MPRTTPVISNYEVPFGLGCRFCKFESQCKDPKQDYPSHPRFILRKYFYCRETSQQVWHQICAYRYYNHTPHCCKDCPIGEAMVEIVQAQGLTVPDRDDKWKELYK